MSDEEKRPDVPERRHGEDRRREERRTQSIPVPVERRKQPDRRHPPDRRDS